MVVLSILGNNIARKTKKSSKKRSRIPKNWKDFLFWGLCLVAAMDGRAKKHDALHYFTRLSVLDSIVKNQAWQFNNSSGMNNLHELIKNYCPDREINEAIQRKRECLYYSCFSFGDEDNVAMWSLYGIPWEDAVCITLGKDSVMSLLNSMDKYSNENNAEPFFHDICYIEGEMGADDQILHWYDCRNRKLAKNDSSFAQNIELVGYLKNSCWRYENESRLGFILNQPNKQGYVRIPLEKGFWNSITITLGPKNNHSIEGIKSMLNQDNSGITFDIEINKSCFLKYGFFQNLKRHCDRCKNSFQYSE